MDEGLKKEGNARQMVQTDSVTRKEEIKQIKMLASVATVLHRTHRKWGVNKETEGWMMRGSLEFLPCADDDDSDEGSDE